MTILLFMLMPAACAGTGSIDDALDAMLRGLGAHYTVAARHESGSFPDPGAEWRLVLKRDLAATLRAAPNFGQADAADRAAFQHSLQEAGLLDTPRSDAVLYRSDVVVPGTVCEAAPCGAYILLTPGSGTVYAGLYKN